MAVGRISSWCSWVCLSLLLQSLIELSTQEQQSPFVSSSSFLSLDEANHLSPLVSIPIYLDQSQQSIEFHFFEGECPEKVAEQFTIQHGINEEQAHFFTKSIEARLAGLRRTPSHRVAIIVAYEDDLHDEIYQESSTSSSGLSVLENMVASIVTHHERGGVHIVLVNNGFVLSSSMKHKLQGLILSINKEVSSLSTCASFEVIELSEVVGFGSAVSVSLENIDSRLLSSNHTLQQPPSHHVRDHAIVGIFTSTMLLKPSKMKLLDNAGDKDSSKEAQNSNLNGLKDEHISIHDLDVGQEDVESNLHLNGGSEGGDIWSAFHSLSKSISMRHEQVLFISPVDHEFRFSPQHVKLFDDMSSTNVSYKSKIDGILQQPWVNTGVTSVSPFPILMFDIEVWKNQVDSYQFDEGYFLQGACADFIAQAALDNVLIDVTSLPFQFAERFLVSTDQYSRIRLLSKLPYFMPSHSTLSELLLEVETLALLDVDHFLSSCLVKEDVGKSMKELNKQKDSLQGSKNAVLSSNNSELEAFMHSPESFHDGARYYGGLLRKQTLEFQFKWMNRKPSHVASQGWSDVLCIGAVMLVYDDALGFVDLILSELIDQVHHVAVLVSAVPWSGPPRSLTQTYELLTKHMNKKSNQGKFSIVTGHWESEEEQRQFGNDLLKKLPMSNGRRITHALVIDGDEFWHPAQLLRSLSLIANVARQAVNVLHPESLELINEEIYAAIAYAVPFARGHMATYWKSVRSVIQPPEQLRILWLISVHCCEWTKARELSCIRPNLNEPVLEFNGLMLDPSAGLVHHLSYVRTTYQLIHQKLASFAHSQDIIDAANERGEVGIGPWIQHKWKGWSLNNSITFLHPTHPTAYDHIEPQPLYLLPPILRRSHVQHQRSHHKQGSVADFPEDDFIKFSVREDLQDEYARRLEVQESNQMLTLIPNIKTLDKHINSGKDNDIFLQPENSLSLFRQLNKPIVLSTEETSNDNSMSSVKLFQAVSSTMTRAKHIGMSNATSIHTVGHFLNSMNSDSIPAELFNDITPNFSSSQPRYSGDICGPLVESKPRIMLLVIGEGMQDTVTFRVFEELMTVVKYGLEKLGCDVVITNCPDLRLCIVTNTRYHGSYFTIIFAAHHLARYEYVNDNQRSMPIIFKPGFHLFTPQNSIFYNFEYIHGQEDMKDIDFNRDDDHEVDSKFGLKISMNMILKQWAKADHLWEYSESNVEMFTWRGFKATYVPLGYAPTLLSPGDSSILVEHQRLDDKMDSFDEIDILLFGKMNERRVNIVKILREQYKLRVYHANHNKLVFDKRLEKLLRKSKIVLSLCYFGFDNEWKFPRFLKTLSLNTNTVLISEKCGGPTEIQTWSDGIVFANTTHELARACQYYLSHPFERYHRSITASRLLLSKPMENEIAVPLVSFVKSVCPDKVGIFDE